MIVDMNRVEAVAEGLRGSCMYDVDDFATTDEQESVEFLSALDELVLQCDTCGWWCETSDIDEDGNCIDCNE